MVTVVIAPIHCETLVGRRTQMSLPFQGLLSRGIVSNVWDGNLFPPTVQRTLCDPWSSTGLHRSGHNRRHGALRLSAWASHGDDESAP
jgi:hypothetical protein